jgi:hypothetical protein
MFTRMTSDHCSGRHLVEEAVAGDAGVVDQHLDRAELRLDLAHRALGVLEHADIALHHHDAELVGGLPGRSSLPE